VLGASLLVGFPATVDAAAMADSVPSAVVTPRVFEPGAAPETSKTTMRYTLAHPMTTQIEIVDYAGKRVRFLETATEQRRGGYAISWDGRVSAGGAFVQDGGYRFRLTVVDRFGTFVVERAMTKAPDAIFPASPGSITVAIDPGHGGPDPGAIRPPLAEKTANLDIALRLRAMLVGAGVRVVMTRTGDSKVNTRQVDWTRDGQVAYRDELAARIEVANRARADVFIVVHNNGTAPGVGGTETWYDATRPFGAINKTLATIVQTNLVKYLRTQATSSWSPKDRGIHEAPFYVLRRYKVHFNERPSQMPGILGESLAMGHKYELLLLRTPRAKQAIAEGYYEALAGFFETRTWGARYELVSGPGSSAVEGSTKVSQIRVTNTSPIAWPAGAVDLTLSAVKAVPWYDGTDAAGTRLATVPLPALASGASVVVDVPFTVPSYASVAGTSGTTILKADLAAGSLRLARAGVPPLQTWLTITAAAGTPPPTPSPTLSPSASPTPSPSASPSVSPAAGSGAGGSTPVATPGGAASTRRPTATSAPTATPSPSSLPAPQSSPATEAP
jgi:N-acetylmuramoyl-L-alanine amidase